MAAAALAVALTSGLTRGIVFSATAFGSTAAAVLAGQHLTHGWLWMYIYRLHQSHETLVEKIWPETPLVLSEYGLVLLVPVAACLLLAALRRRLSRGLVYWASMAAAGLATSAVASATEGAYDNAYIPAVYFGALLAAACVVELTALGAGLPAAAGAVWSSAAPRAGRAGRLPAVGLLGLGLLSAHVLSRGPDLAPHVPTRQDVAAARRLIDYLRAQGPEILVPSHPFYNVLAGGRGHLHVMGVNDVYTWPRAITSDPARDATIKERFRESVSSSFRARRWKVVVQDDCPTPRLFGLNRHYRPVGDLALEGRAPRSFSGYPCTPRQVWVPRAERGTMRAPARNPTSSPSPRARRPSSNLVDGKEASR
jgi:hypothetical protein